MQNITTEPNGQQSNVETPKRGRKAKVEEQKADKALKTGHLSKKNGTAVKTTVANKKQKAGKKAKKDEDAVQSCTSTPGIGDLTERIYATCEKRGLSLGSRRSAVSILNAIWKKYNGLPTPEQIKADCTNPKQRGNWLWLLKVVS